MEQRLFIHAIAGIADADRHIVADIHVAAPRQRRTKNVLRLDENLAATWHGITSVNDEVEDHLFEVGLVHHHGADRTRVNDQFDLFADETGENAG